MKRVISGGGRDSKRARLKQSMRSRKLIEDAYRRNLPEGIARTDSKLEQKHVELELQDTLGDMLPWAYMLLERNMKSLYEGSWGWDEEKKREELVSRRARFVIAYHVQDKSRDPIAFVHYRYVQEAREPVVYVYEIQIDALFQGLGIGRALMTTVENICKERGLDAICLTVFTENEGAMRFYKRRARALTSLFTLTLHCSWF
mmetsp:Transcript_6200/g.21976  ORF Transcript_6200/g.21976 Transcript_6200/m.21976 type:complete len:202 (+) Transcript_6200:71-676(+)